MNSSEGIQRKEGLFSFLSRCAERHAWFLPAVFSVLTFLIFLPGVLIADLPMSDVHLRYAPMAEEFAAGEWAYAFHPRIPPFLPVLGGCFVKLFGISGFSGVKLAGLLCFSLMFTALIPLFRRIFDLRTTITAGILAMFLSPLLRLVFAGLREPAKGVFFIWAAYCLIRLWQEKRSLGALLMLGTACAGMCMVKDDSVLFALLFLLTAFLTEIFRSRLFPWRTVLAGLTAAVLLLPLLWLNYRMTGYPVPSNRFVSFAEKVLPFRCFDRNADRTRPADPVHQAVPKKGEIPLQGPKAVNFLYSFHTMSLEEYRNLSVMKWSAKNILDLLGNVLSGFFLWYFLPALAVIVIRIRRGKWRSEETILLAVPLLHTLFLVVQIAIADGWLLFPRRYPTPLVPLFCGWTATAFLWCSDRLRERFGGPVPKRAEWTVCILVLIGLYAYGLLPEIQELTSSNKRAMRSVLFGWADQIRADYRGPKRTEDFFVDSERYISFRRPHVYSDKLHELGYLAGGESLPGPLDPLKRFTRLELIRHSLAYENRGAIGGFIPDYIAEDVTSSIKGMTEAEVRKALELPNYRIMDMKTMENKHTYVLWKLIPDGERGQKQ